jgi:hypothetical protein
MGEHDLNCAEIVASILVDHTEEAHSKIKEITVSRSMVFELRLKFRTPINDNTIALKVLENAGINNVEIVGTHMHQHSGEMTIYYRPKAVQP